LKRDTLLSPDRDLDAKAMREVQEEGRQEGEAFFGGREQLQAEAIKKDFLVIRDEYESRLQQLNLKQKRITEVYK